MRRALWLILILFMTMQLLPAQETGQQTVAGKRIDAVVFEGLVNIEQSALDQITKKYVDKTFSEQLFNELQSELYSLQYFSYFTAYADQVQDNPNRIRIRFQVTELPYIEQIVFEGNDFFTDEDIIDLFKTKEASFYSNAALTADINSLITEYRDKGYVSAAVEQDAVKDEETNTVVITVTINEGRQSKIDVIAFEGNEIFSSNSLKRIITSKEQSLFNKGNYSETTVQQDKNAIIQYYRERGYVEAAVTDTRIETDTSDATKDLITLTFVIDEGDQWFFGGLEVTGNEIFSNEEIERRITLDVGEPIDIVTLQKNISSIADLYWNEGYIYNEIVPQETKNERDRTISYTLTITEKQQAYVEDIIIKGNEKTKDHVLSRELAINVGDVFSKEKFIESVQNLYNTGIISNVDYNVLFGTEDGYIVLEFIVEEAKKVELQFGATFGGNDSFPVTGFFSWTDKNFMGYGQDFSIATNIASSSQSLDFSFTEDWLAGKRWNGGVSFSMSHNSYDSILQDASGVTFSSDDYYNGTAAPDPYNSYAEYQAALENGDVIADEYLMNYEQYKISLGLDTGYTFHTDVGRIGLGTGLDIGLTYVQYDDALFRPYNPIIRDNLDTWQFSNKISLNANWDGRDLVENTTRGFLISDNLIYAGGLLGGASNYIRNTFGLSAYQTLFRLNEDELNPRNIVLSARSNISHIFPQFFDWTDGFGWQDQPYATQSEKLYIDGMNIVRGIDNPVYNLEFMWDTSAYITVPIVPNVLSGEIYASGTGFKSQIEDWTSLSIQDFYFSMGGGVKLDIPGFPLGIYLSKVFSVADDNSIEWQPGEIFANAANPDSGLNLVLAITYSLY